MNVPGYTPSSWMPTPEFSAHYLPFPDIYALLHHIRTFVTYCLQSTAPYTHFQVRAQVTFPTDVRSPCQFWTVSPPSRPHPSRCPKYLVSAFPRHHDALQLRPDLCSKRSVLSSRPNHQFSAQPMLGYSPLSNSVAAIPRLNPTFFLAWLCFTS